MLYFYPVKKGASALEKRLIAQLEHVCQTEPEMKGLDLFLAMSIFRLQLLPQTNPALHEWVQINLMKEGKTTGCKIIRIGKGTLAYAINSPTDQ